MLVFQKGFGSDEAVVEGIGRTGRLVTSAALILGLAFVAFSATPGSEAKIFATALGGGILIEATIIRGILAPAQSRSSAAGTGGSRTGPRAFSALNRHAHSRSQLPIPPLRAVVDLAGSAGAPAPSAPELTTP